MVQLLVRLFVKDYENIQNPRVRARYGTLSGGMGILLNLCLFGAKCLAGWLTGSIAVVADAFNNLSDAGSSLVTLLGFRLAERPADAEHPFGHGRIEYISALAVSMAILLVGLELGKSSLEKILHPEPVEFSLLSLCILAGSVLVKLWMCYLNRSLGRRIDSTAMRATAMDSLTDAVATAAVLLGMGVGLLLHWQIDGWMGLLVAAFILYTGYTTARDSLSPLLGQPPDPAFVQSIREQLLLHPEVLGLHDLIVHDYGPGRRMISLHAEMPCTMELMAMHDLTDRIELELRQRFQCDVTIHMDPVAVDDPECQRLCGQVQEALQSIDPQLSLHDFRIVRGATHTNLIFDVLVPYRFKMEDAQITGQIRKAVTSLGEEYFAVIHLDRGYL